MKLLLLLNIIWCLEINDVYVDDPKKSFKSSWESMALVLHDNREWKHELRHVSYRRDFVKEMLNIKNGKIQDIFRPHATPSLNASTTVL